jgi:hypothetical protein
METISNVNQDVTNETYAYAANLLVNQKMSSDETKNALVTKGIDLKAASTVVENLEQQIQGAKKERAKKDMLYGALWCVGGIIATAAHIGFIFWGAIIFGGIQFFKGLANA